MARHNSWYEISDDEDELDAKETVPRSVSWLAADTQTWLQEEAKVARTHSWCEMIDDEEEKLGEEETMPRPNSWFAPDTQTGCRTSPEKDRAAA